MDRLGDIELFVRVVKQKGLAAAGKQLGMSPATVTARLKRLESSHKVRLLTRTTRQISLTDEGSVFYQHCLNILNEVDKANESLLNQSQELQGNLKITSTVDIGKKKIAPALIDFIKAHPKITAHLHLADNLIDIIDGDFDLAIRIGGLEDNRMVARKLTNNSRLLLASPAYLAEFGIPKTPEELLQHKCLVLAEDNQSFSTWHFTHQGVASSIDLQPVLGSNDGSLLREWATAGFGIVLMSFWSVKSDLQAGKLVSILDNYHPNYWSSASANRADLYAVYPSKDYLPKRTRAFIDLLQQRFNE